MSKKLKEVLDYCDKPCMCEAYYRYRCAKCSEYSEFYGTHKEELRRADTEGLIEYRNGSMRLTKKGENIKKQLEGDFS